MKSTHGMGGPMRERSTLPFYQPYVDSTPKSSRIPATLNAFPLREPLYLDSLPEIVEAVQATAEATTEAAEAVKMVTNSAGGLLVFYIFYSAIFGSTRLGWDGIIDKQIKHDLYNRFVRRHWLEKGGATTKQALKLSKPAHDTQALEDHSKDEEQQRKPVTYLDLEEVFNNSAD
jgi:hypothetical protein